MGLFTPNYMKEGKGVRKDEPPKKGIMRFFEIIARDSGDIVKLNIFFIISCIPIITIGPALVAMNTVMLKRVRNIPCYVFHEYKQAFKENFVKGLLAGLFTFFVQGLMSFALYFYWATYNSNGDIFYLILISVSLVASLVMIAASGYIFSTIGVVDLPLSKIIKNSFLLAIGFLPRTLAIVVTSVVAGGILVLFFPFTMITAVIFHFGVTSVIINMNVWAVVDKVFVQGYYDKKDEDEVTDEDEPSPTDD